MVLLQMVWHDKRETSLLSEQVFLQDLWFDYENSQFTWKMKTPDLAQSHQWFWLIIELRNQRAHSNEYLLVEVTTFHSFGILPAEST